MAGERVSRKVEIFHSGAWEDISADAVDHDGETGITRGVRNEGGSAAPGSLELTLNNSTSNVNPAVSSRYARGNALSDLFGLLPPNTPIRVSAGLAGGAQTVRMAAETVALPPRSDVSQRDLWVPVEAAGVLRRLGIPSSPLPPALQRSTPEESAVVASWPLAGLGQGVTRAPSSVAGVAPIVVRPTIGPNDREFAVEWSADSRAPGLGAMPSVRNEPNTSVGFTGAIPSGISDRFGWSIWGRAEGTDVGNEITMWIDTDGTRWLMWLLWENHTNSTILVTVRASDSDGNTVADLQNTTTIPFDDRWHQFAAIVEQSGADADLTVLLDGEEIAMTLNSGSLSGLTIGEPRQTRPTASLLTGNGGTSIGYPTVLTGASVAVITAAVQDLYTAGRGYDGETAGRRVERLCAEQGVSFTSTGDLDASAPLGPQHPDEFLTVIGEAAKVEAGGSRAPILTEQRTANGLHFNTLASLYLPRTPDLTLDYEAAHLSPPFDPTPDDFALVNDATAKRRDGGEARIEVSAGPKGITAAGRYDKAETFGVLSDTHLDGIARYWSLHGTWDEDRYPVIRIDMRGLSTRTDGTALVAAVQALDPGALIRITNPPAWLPQQNIEQIVLGITETISTEQWLVDLHTTAAAPFTVAVLEDAEVGLAQSDSATLDEPLDATETAVDIDAGAGPDWVHDGVDFDIVIRPATAPSLSGERMTVTAVGAMTGTFPARKVTLTVTRSVNGIVTTHAAGAKVEWATKAYIGLWG